MDVKYFYQVLINGWEREGRARSLAHSLKWGYGIFATLR